MSTTSVFSFRRLTIGAAALAAFGLGVAAAQFGPPSTVFGSITDEAGVVPEGMAVEAYVGDKLCGKGKTQFTGDGDGRVTVYWADVVSREQTAGCGFTNAEVRLKIGDRFAEQTAKWQAGPVQLDITFGNVQPKPIPTFTPAPSRTPVPGVTAAVGEATGHSTPQPSGTIPAGSPGAGSPVATLSGGLVSSTSGGDGGSGDEGRGGFPVWAVVVLVLGGIAAVGGGVGFALSRAGAGAAGDDNFPGGPD
ncbi:MAG: hypothetical protein ACR2HN_06825 [Tepidiformaceae bacterium]